MRHSSEADGTYVGMEHAEGDSPGPVRAAIDGLSDTARTAHSEIEAVAESIGLAMQHITDSATSGAPGTRQLSSNLPYASSPPA